MLRRNRLGWLAVAAGLGMAVAGIARGELRDVFVKAATICLECIGLR